MGSIARTIGYADTSAPPAPTLTVTAQGTDTLVASWTAVTDTGSGLRYYRLYVGSSAGNLTLTETFSRATTAWLITGLPAQSTRYVRVDAIDGAGNVTASAVVSGTTQASGSGGALAFAQPSPVTYAAGQTVSLALSQYVTGGGATKLYHRISGSLPGDLSLETATGAITGTARQSGSYAPVIRVTDTTADALEADWLARSRATGVVWAHDFRDDAAVTRFRINGASGSQVDASGNSLVRRNASDGVKGSGCLELYTVAGVENQMRWARPFVALPGDIGYSSGAALIPQWYENQYQFRRGMYGHPDYWGQTGSGYSGDGSSWAGHDFYIQFRVKTPAVAYSPLHPPGYAGKMAYIEICGGGNQELILSYGRKLGMFTNFGRANTNPLHEPQGQAYQNTSLMQPNTAYADSYDNAYAACWSYPDDEWVTVLLHVIPGHDSDEGSTNDVPSSTSNWRRDFGIECWVARYGATSYTKVWEKFDYVWSYDAQSPGYGALSGFNCLLFTQYMNFARTGLVAGVDWWRRHDEVIFSTRPIACPQVYA